MTDKHNGHVHVKETFVAAIFALWLLATWGAIRDLENTQSKIAIAQSQDVSAGYDVHN